MSVGKFYVAVFTCASKRAGFLKLCHELSAEKNQKNLKEFVASCLTNQRKNITQSVRVVYHFFGCKIID